MEGVEREGEIEGGRMRSRMRSREGEIEGGRVRSSEGG